MMANDFVNNEAEKLFGKLRVQLRFFSQISESRDLAVFAIRIGGRKRGSGFVLPNRLRDSEALSENVNERRIDIVYRAAITCKYGILTRTGRIKRCILFIHAWLASSESALAKYLCYAHGTAQHERRHYSPETASGKWSANA